MASDRSAPETRDLPWKSSRQAVDAVANCARLINLSYFANRNDGWLGPSVLEQLTTDQADNWARFKELWESAAQGPELLIDQETGVVRTLANRNRKGNYTDARISVFETVGLLLGGCVPGRILHDWYRANLRKTYDLADNVLCVEYSRKWLLAFNNLTRASCTRDVLLGLVPGEPLWAQGLVEGLEYLAIIGFDQEGYRLSLNANEAFVFANLLGYSTGSVGLDALLYGALRVPEGSLSIAIVGPPGLGKSTLAMTLGAQVAARGGFCQFFRFEVEETTVVRQLRHFFRDRLPYFDLEETDLQSLPDETAYPDVAGGEENEDPSRHALHLSMSSVHKGLFRISGASTADITDLEDQALQLGKRSEFRERIVILDSITAIQGYGQPPSEWRSKLFETVSLLRSRGFVVVFIVEKDDINAEDFEAYLADVVIRLSRRWSADNFTYFPTLQVFKSRLQIVHAGVHRFGIRFHSGLAISMSSESMLDSLGNRGKRYYFQQSPIPVGMRGVASYLGGVRQASGSDDRGVAIPFWKRSSVTLCTGPRGSLKSAFAREFLEARDPEAEPPSTLSINFSDPDRPELHETRRKDRQVFPFGVRFDREHGERGADGRFSTYTYLWFRGSGTVTPEDVLSVVREVLHEQKRRQTAVGRAAISDLATLPTNFPALAEDPNFIPALIELLASEAVTTLITYSQVGSEQHTADVLQERIQGLAENVIQFATVGAPGRDRLSIRVDRSAGNSHDRGVCEIRLSTDGKPEVVPSFDLLLDPFTDSTRVTPIHLFLHAQTGIQNRYCGEYEAVEAKFGVVTVNIDDRTGDQYAASLGRRVLANRGLFLAQVDNRHLPLEHGELQRSLLADLDRYQEMVDLTQQLVNAPALGISKRKCPVIPYYLNPPLLTASPEFLEFLNDQYPQIAKGEGDYTWDDLLTAAKAFRKGRIPEGNPILSIQGADTLNCLFLEILASLRSSMVNSIELKECFAPGSSLRAHDKALGSSPLFHTVCMMRDLLGGRGPARQDLNSPSILRREWYCFFRETQSELRRPLMLPGKIWTCGDWYLGIIEGSMAIRTGVRMILDQFVNRAVAMDLMNRGVGLTPFRDYYSGMSDYRVGGIPLSRFESYANGRRVIYRSLIRQYARISSTVRLHLSEIVQLEKPDFDHVIEERFDFMGRALMSQ